MKSNYLFISCILLILNACAGVSKQVRSDYIAPLISDSGYIEEIKVYPDRARMFHMTEILMSCRKNVAFEFEKMEENAVFVGDKFIERRRHVEVIGTYKFPDTEYMKDGASLVHITHSLCIFDKTPDKFIFDKVEFKLNFSDNPAYKR